MRAIPCQKGMQFNPYQSTYVRPFEKPLWSDEQLRHISKMVPPAVQSGPADALSYEEVGVGEVGVDAVDLGTAGFTTLARAGRVAERTPGALSLADSMFRTGLAPWGAVQPVMEAADAALG